MSYNKQTGLYEGFIYCLTNKINGKKYIGQTITTIEHRVSQHFSKRRKRKYAISLAIKKYGKENFLVDEIAKISNATKEKLIEELNVLEKEYIKKYKTLTSQHGYNIDIGGASCHYFSKPIVVYDLDGNYIRNFESMSDAARYYNIDVTIISDMCNGSTNRSKKCNYIFRFKSDSFNKYDTTYKIGGAKKVYQFTLDGVFVASYKSILDAEKFVNPNYQNKVGGSSIGEAIKNNKTAYGFVWSYDKQYKFNPEEYRNWMPVDQYSMDGKFLKSYFSITEAAKNIGKPTKGVTNIRSVCKGKTFNAYGYVWRYKGDPFDKYPTKRIYTNNKPVDQYTRDGVFVTSYDSAKNAGISLGKDYYAPITSCCKGKIKTAFNYVWRYRGEPFDKFNSSLYNNKKVNQYTLDDIFVKTYSSSVEALKEMDINYYGSIHKCCNKKAKTFKGYKWYFADDPNQPDKSKIIIDNQSAIPKDIKIE